LAHVAVLAIAAFAASIVPASTRPARTASAICGIGIST
jgi:hypothetical protein